MDYGIAKDSFISAQYIGGYSDRNSWDLIINADRTASYTLHSKSEGKKIAVRFIINESDMARLIQLLSSPQLLSLRDNYASTVTDGDTRLLTFHLHTIQRDIKVYALSMIKNEPQLEYFEGVWNTLEALLPDMHITKYRKL